MNRHVIPLLLCSGLWGGAAFAAPPTPDAAARAELTAARDALHSAARDYAALLEKHGLPPPGPLGLGDPLRGHLGLRLGPPATGPEGQRGRLVRDVAPDSGAARAGIEEGDVLLSVNAQPLPDEREPRGPDDARLRLEIGDTVPVRLARDGEILTLEVTATAAPSSHARHRRGRLPAWQLATLSAALAPYFGTDQGVLVLRVPDDSRFPLQPGDVITAVDGTPVADPRALFRAVMRGEGEVLQLAVRRRGHTLTLDGPRPERPLSLAPDRH